MYHLKRDDIHSPWENIGVIAANGTEMQIIYLPEYKYIENQLKSEVVTLNSPYITSSREFLEGWRKRHSDTLTVITPIINYVSASKNFRDMIEKAYVMYVGSLNFVSYAMLTIMILMKDEYLAVLYQRGAHNPERIEMIKAWRNRNNKTAVPIEIEEDLLDQITDEE